MGHKVNPEALRRGFTTMHWRSRWITLNREEQAMYIGQDKKIRQGLLKELKNAGVSDIEIERTKGQITLFIHCVRVGTVLGQGAANLEKLNKLVKKIIKTRSIEIKIQVVEIKNPDLEPQILANTIAMQLENRMSHRLAQKAAIRKAIRAGAKGCKIRVSGRLGGADMARIETYSEGSIPLSKLRADIRYALAEANTISGLIGVKVWIYLGDMLPGEKRKENIAPIRKNSNRGNMTRRSKEVKADGKYTKKI